MSAKLLRDTWSVARFETLRTLGSVRGVLVLLLFLTASALTGAFYVTFVRMLEDKAVDIVAQAQGPSGTREAVDITKLDAYQKMVESFAGDDAEKAELWKTTPPIVLVSFWLALAFLPFLVMLTAHDALARDNELRTLRYVRPRLSMSAWVLGKFFAQALLAFAATVAAGGLIYAIGICRLETFGALQGGLALATFWWRVLAFELSVLGVLFVLSAISRSAFTALVASTFTLFALWILHFLSYWKDGDTLATGAYVSYLSPFTYRDGLWYPAHSSQLWIAVAVHAAFAIVGVGASIYSLEKRDL